MQAKTEERRRPPWKESAVGFHMLDFIVIAAIGLALFGPKALQTVARSAGKGVSQAKDVKDKIMAELPMEEIAKMTDSIPQVPLNPQQAVRMLMASEQKETSKKDTATKTTEPLATTPTSTATEAKVDA